MEKLKYGVVLFVICSLIGFSSCSTPMKYTTLEVLRPAKIKFDNDAVNLLIVNNTTVQPANFGHILRYYSGRAENVSVPTDSVALFCLSALNEEVWKKGFFASVDLQLESTNSSTDFNEVKPLQHATVVDLCKEYDADVVLSLDRIMVKDEVAEYSFMDSNVYTAIHDVAYETLWSIHYPNKVQVTPVLFRDSLYWEEESYVQRNAIERLPNREDALIDGALFVGRKTANRIIPYWTKVDRYFFDPDDKLMRQAMDSVYVRNWDGAITLWNEAAANTSKKKMQAEAANNIAIAYEILGEYDEAIKYAENSLDFFLSKSVSDIDAIIRLSDYVEELKKRKEEVDLLDTQLGY